MIKIKIIKDKVEKPYLIFKTFYYALNEICIMEV